MMGRKMAHSYKSLNLLNIFGKYKKYFEQQWQHHSISNNLEKSWLKVCEISFTKNILNLRSSCFFKYLKNRHSISFRREGKQTEQTAPCCWRTRTKLIKNIILRFSLIFSIKIVSGNIFVLMEFNKLQMNRKKHQEFVTKAKEKQRDVCITKIFEWTSYFFLQFHKKNDDGLKKDWIYLGHVTEVFHERKSWRNFGQREKR